MELALKDAFKKSYFEKIEEMFVSLYYLYQNSPKRLQSLMKLADVMGKDILKPARAQGTRWIQHKVNAANAVKMGYAVIVGHLENMAEDTGTPAKDQAKVRGYLRTIKSFQLVIHLLQTC